MAKVLPNPLADAVGKALFRYGQSEDYDNLPGSEAAVALAAIPDGWAKVDGEWVRLRPVNVRADAGRRTYEEA